ncbi:MAG TPA: hypothetical protein DDW91_17805 [Shewanella frigidimarina]|nr:hypothetical protein [Shewanella frigidimarina]
MRNKDDKLTRLAARMMQPRYGFSQMHYSSVSSIDAVKAFETLANEFKQSHRLNIPRRAYDIVEHGKGCKIDVVGIYWMIEEI